MGLVFFYTHLWKDEITINYVSKAVMLNYSMQLWAVVCRQSVVYNLAFLK